MKFKFFKMHLKKIFGILLVFLIGTTTGFSQLPQQVSAQQPKEVGDEELEKFTLAFSEVQIIDQQLQEEMMSTVENKGIDVVRFNDYLEAQQNPSLEFEANNLELEKFEATFKEIEGLHDSAEKEMQQAIVDNDLSVDRYQQIAMSVKEDPALLEKFQQHLQEQWNGFFSFDIIL